MTNVYVINLDRSTERLARIKGSLDAAGLSFERVQAVDATCLPDEAWVGRYDPQKNKHDYLAPLSLGEIACILSHRVIWRHFLEQRDAEIAVVLEDDAVMLGSAKETLDFVERTCSCAEPAYVKMNSLRSCTSVRRPVSAHPAFLPLLTTAAQALNRPAAERLIAFTDSFHEPLDVALQRWWDHGVRMFQAVPPLFAEERGPLYASTIRGSREVPPEGRLLRELRRPIFQARRLAIAVSASLSRPQA